MITRVVLFRDTLGYLSDVLKAHRENGSELRDPLMGPLVADLREAVCRELKDARGEIRKISSASANRAERDLFRNGKHKTVTEWETAAHRFLNNGFTVNEYTSEAILSNGNETDARDAMGCIKALEELCRIFQRERSLEDLNKALPWITKDIETINTFVNREARA